MNTKNPLRAVWMLALGTMGWGISFPLMKAVVMAQSNALPMSDSWFHSALSLATRFGLCAAILALRYARPVRSISRSEWRQGIGLGLFGGPGLLLQSDGTIHTAASTAAFLTQCYCVIIPVIVALKNRRAPSLRVVASCAMVFAGVAVLAGVDWRVMRLGRGEWETILGSLFFTAQILWLERPEFSRNNTGHTSLVMFTVIGAMLGGVALWNAGNPSQFLVPFGSPTVLVLTAILTLACTLFPFLVMNYWQPHVDATRAGLIYCVEPLVASLAALFLPAWLSAFAGVNYANERAAANLLIGGGLITVANILIQMQSPTATPVEAAAMGREGGEEV